MSASLGTFVTIDEKSDVLLLMDSRCVVTPFAFRYVWAASARPDRVRLLESKMTTFFTLSLSTMNGRQPAPGCRRPERRGRKTASPTSRSPFVRDVRVADGEMCARPAAKSVVLDAATAPDVDGPMTATTFLSATYFCASDGAGLPIDWRVAGEELDLEAVSSARAS